MKGDHVIWAADDVARGSVNMQSGHHVCVFGGSGASVTGSSISVRGGDASSSFTFTMFLADCFGVVEIL